MKAPLHAIALVAAACAFGQQPPAQPAQTPAAANATTNTAPAQATNTTPAAPARATNATPATPTTTPARATSATSAAATRDSTDEIDLDEADDSAEARDKAPVVTAATVGERVTLVDIACDNATLEDVLRQFRKGTDANIISDDSTNLQRRVSVTLHHVPWLDGLQSILNSRN